MPNKNDIVLFMLGFAYGIAAVLAIEILLK